MPKAPWAAAADSERAKKWQASIPVTFTSSSTVESLGGTSFTLDSDVGWGISFGYNVNDRFLVGADITWIGASYDAGIGTDLNGDRVPDQIVPVAGTLDVANLQFLGQCNFLDRAVTPFLRGSVGWSWVDSNIPVGPSVGACWFDPFHGYVCGAWQPTAEATELAFGAALGVRADIKSKFFVEASYSVLFVDFSNAETASFDGVRLNLGWSF